MGATWRGRLRLRALRSDALAPSVYFARPATAIARAPAELTDGELRDRRELHWVRREIPVVRARRSAPK
ncbi:MAG: hypothetical protein RL077_537 [Verrucomicrobiota bacterium]|jgi:hypothetical protein